ncbi:MAG TPA: hypothetical protein VG826_27510 [Pirellulales bacterium]|nr:hypothetical protein [Pirellulales bacterium]
MSRRFQFSLRWLVIAVALIAVATGSFLWQRELMPGSLGVTGIR